MRVPGLSFVLALSSLVAAGAPCCAQPQRSQEISSTTPVEAHQPEAGGYSEQIIWYDADPSQALFIPQKELAATALEQLPVPSFALDRIREAMRYPEERKLHKLASGCMRAPDLGEPVPEESRKTLDELVASSSLAFVGTVVATVPGWSVWQDIPVTAVYVRIDEVLRNQGDFLRTGETVATTQEQATIDLFGIEACSKLPPGVQPARTGDQVLFTGARFEQHPLFVLPHYIFPVRGDEVLPQPWRVLRDAKPEPLDQLRTALQPEEER